MEGTPLVSVIMNCYNSERYLREAIDSVMAQTYQNWEIVFWDNGSTDSSAEIVNSYNSPKIHYYMAPVHTNLGEARNQAMKKANGKFVSFLDCDDWWDAQFLEKGIDVMKCGDYGVYYCNFYYASEGEKILANKEKISGKRNLTEVLKYYKIGMSANIINSSCISEYGISFNPDFRLIEDYDFFIKIGKHYTFYYNSLPQAYYRIHKSSSSFTYREGWYKELNSLYSSLITECEQEGKPVSEYISVRSNMEHYHAEDYIRNNDRIGLLKLIVKNYDLHELWKKMLCVVFGCKFYNRLRGVH